MPGNLILLKSYECHMISDKVLFLRHNTLIGKASRLLLMMIIVFVSKVHAQNPVASFSVPSSQGCVPFNVQFNNTSINAVSYQWSFGNGNTSTLANPSNVFTIAGTYTVTLTAFSSNGSSNSYSSQIIVQPKPAANFSVDINSGCQNSQIFTFTNLSTNFDSCNWDFGDGTTSNQWNPTHIYNLSGTFNVTLVVYNKVLGCSDLLVKGSFITILPAPSAMISVNDTSTCDNNFNFQFTALMNNAVSWNWDFDDGSFSSAMNPMHVFTDTGYFNVSLILTSSNGCVDKVYAPTPVHIKWNPLPVANISQDTGCMPLNLSLNTTYYSNTLYSWNLGNGITKTGSTVYYNYPDSGIFPVTLTATYSNGCQRQVNAGPVVVHPRPVFVFWMTNHTGCAPLNVQCVNQPAGNYTWLWDFGDGTTSTQQVPSHVYTAQGVYSVNLTGTSVNGCTYSYTQSLKINVFSPNAAFSTDVSSGCPPLSVNFSNNSTMASGYQWDFGDGTTSTQIHPTHVYTSPGTYTVKLIASDAGGCKDTLIVVNKITVSAATVNYQTPPDINGCAPYPVNFSDASGAASFLWDFGDGTTSTSANPYHVYTAPGILCGFLNNMDA
jgi:PKD repeat protein